jgi:nucleoside-diphosphate-sugar epimerase
MGIAAFPGPRDAYLPMIWVDDAARALVAALTAPSGVYDVVDDEPLTRGELFAALAQSVGRARLRVLPRWLMGLLAGPMVETLGRSQRVSNSRFKSATGWTPAVPNARIDLARIVGVAGPRSVAQSSEPAATLSPRPDRPIKE